MKKETILVSECLAGINCTYDDSNNENKDILELMKTHNLVLVCPEQLGGLSTPRVPAEQLGDKVFDKNGKDVTINFNKGASEALRIAKMYNCKKAILKAKSPSCGSKQIYDGSHSGKIIPGMGVTTILLRENGIEVINENDLS